MERRISPLFGVFSKNPLQVQLFSHQAQYKLRQMPRWYPIQHRWRHQLILFWNPISKCLRHAPIQFLSTVKYGPHYLDRLREGETRAKRARGSLTHHLELQYVASELESLHDTGCSNRWCSAFRNAGTERRATSTYCRCLKRAAAR